MESSDLMALADWLTRCGVTTVAMESTGIYWIPLFELLEARGFEVFLVDPRQSRHAPGRPKTDVRDCQWLQRLHSYGLLTASFRPAEQIVVLRSYLRQRQMLLRYAGQHIQHMQNRSASSAVLLKNAKPVATQSVLHERPTLRRIAAIADCGTWLFQPDHLSRLHRVPSLEVLVDWTAIDTDWLVLGGAWLAKPAIWLAATFLILGRYRAGLVAGGCTHLLRNRLQCGGLLCQIELARKTNRNSGCEKVMRKRRRTTCDGDANGDSGLDAAEVGCDRGG
jgi:hypothetical protein